MKSSEDPTAIQLRLIHALTTVLEAAQIPHWLFGGWVVDFLAGEITRPHHDIDFLLRLPDAPALRDLQARQGYTELPSPSGPELDARFRKQDQLVEVMFVQAREDGGADWGGRWHLPPGSLAARHGCIGEIRCPIVNPQLLLECKEACISDEDDASELEKHRRDIARLRAMIRS